MNALGGGLSRLLSLNGFNDINGGGLPEEDDVGGGMRVNMFGGRGGPRLNRLDQREQRRQLPKVLPIRLGGGGGAGGGGVCC